MLASVARAAVAAEYRMPFFLGAMAVLVNNGLVSLAYGARRLQPWLSLRALRGRQCLHQVCRWLQHSSVGASAIACDRCLRRCMQVQVVGLARAGGASACNGTFGAGGGRSSHRSFSARGSSHRSPGSNLGFHQGLLPNPSLVGTATGKALGPRTGQCQHPLRGPSAFPASAPQLKR